MASGMNRMSFWYYWVHQFSVADHTHWSWIKRCTFLFYFISRNNYCNSS